MSEASEEYSTAQAAKRAGISAQTVRNLTSGPFAGIYAGLFSEGATKPGQGRPRRLTENDLRLLVLIHAQTERGLSHEVVAQMIRAGEVVAPAMPQEAAEPVSAMGEKPHELAQPAQLALMAQGLMAEVMAAREREAALYERLIAAEARAAELAAQLARERRPFWRRWFGG